MDEDKESYILLKNLVVILVAMWAGSWLSGLFTRLGITLPAYVGAMFVAAFIRNFDDWTGLLKLSQRTIDDIGHIALSLFLVIALMTLRLWELAGLILPLVIILARAADPGCGWSAPGRYSGSWAAITSRP